MRLYEMQLSSDPLPSVIFFFLNTSYYLCAWVANIQCLDSPSLDCLQELWSFFHSSFLKINSLKLHILVCINNPSLCSELPVLRCRKLWISTIFLRQLTPVSVYARIAKLWLHICKKWITMITWQTPKHS